MPNTVNKDLIKKKFSLDGKMLHFSGNTIVWHAHANRLLYELAENIQLALMELKLPNVFFLPKSSFHVTIMELLCDQERRTDYWSKKIPKNLKIIEVTNLIHEMLGESKFELDVTFLVKELVSSDVFIIELCPFSKSDRNKLKNFRDIISEKTGIRFPNHDSYKFHLTLGYKLLPEIKSINLEEEIKNINKKYLSDKLLIKIDTVHLTEFENMGKFRNIN